MALNDALIFETVVSPVANGTIVRVQIADAPLRDGLMDAEFQKKKQNLLKQTRVWMSALR